MNRIVLTALAECIDDPVKVKDLFKIQLRNNWNLRQMLNEAGEPDDLPDGVALEVENEKLKEELKSYENGEQYYLFFEDEEDYKTHIQELRSEDSKELAKNIDDVARRNNKLELENDKLKKELTACREVNAFAMLKLNEITTEQNLAEMVGLGKDTGSDIAIIHIIQDFMKLKEDNKLQSEMISLLEEDHNPKIQEQNLKIKELKGVIRRAKNNYSS